MHYNHCHRATAHLQLNIYYINIFMLIRLLPYEIYAQALQCQI
jgi:hypothetical protein